MTADELKELYLSGQRRGWQWGWAREGELEAYIELTKLGFLKVYASYSCEECERTVWGSNDRVAAMERGYDGHECDDCCKPVPVSFSCSWYPTQALTDEVNRLRDQHNPMENGPLTSNPSRTLKAISTSLAMSSFGTSAS